MFQFSLKVILLRLVRWMYAQPNTSSPNYELQKYTPIWMKQYKQRLKAEMQRLKMSKSTNALTLLNRTWPNRGTLVISFNVFHPFFCYLRPKILIIFIFSCYCTLFQQVRAESRQNLLMPFFCI